MRSVNTFTTITFMVMVLFFALCGASPPAKPLQTSHNTHNSINDSIASVLPNNFTDTGVSRAGIPVNLSPDWYKIKDRCYYWDQSEKWRDMGGQYSDFVLGAAHDLCDLIATFASNEGFRKDQTIRHCKAVPANTQGQAYDRSIGVSLTYRGPDEAYTEFNAQYCFDLLAKPLGCGAGGEFRLKFGSTPQWWEVIADPNRHTCSDNGYDSTL
ncbi:hypothetical protein Daus18300_000036 [Diaporthe australafricana]|uniref:Uncharacterized protein n=1 Tax=Diaporthe australafricana TaxID=127596 RepID=A0ABR3Y6L0_9PEZI